MLGNRIDDACRLRLRQVGERDYREVVAEVASNVGLEPLPGPAMSLYDLAGYAIDFPAEPVGVATTAVQSDR